MNFIKKQSIGTWITLGAVLLSLIALIIYGAGLSAGMDLNTSSNNQVFYSASRPEDAAMIIAVAVCGALSLVMLATVIVLGQFKFEGLLGKIMDIVAGVLKIVAPALIIVALLYYVYGSFTGLGWTFFSEKELVIYPEAIKVGKTVIAGLVFFGIAAVASIVAAFFGLVKKEKKEAAEAAA